MATKRIIQLPTLNNWQVTWGNSSQWGYLRRLPNELPWWDWPNPKLVIQTPQTDANGNITGWWWKKTAMNSPEEPEVWTYKWNNGVVQTIDKRVQQGWQPATTYGSKTDRSASLLNTGKNWTTNGLPQATPANLPWVTKYAGIDKNYWNNQAGIDLVNKQNELDTLSEAEKAQRLAGAYNPTPTVATTQNPVIKKTLDKPQEQTITPAVLQGADMNTLNSTLDELNYKVNVEGKALTKDEYLTYASAKRQLQDMMKPQALTGGLDGLIANKENEIKQVTDESKINNEQELADFTKSQEVYKQAELDNIQKSFEREQETMRLILAWQWAGQGTFAVDKLNELSQNNQQKISILNEAVQAKIDLYGSQLRKDSQATIEAMKTRLDNFYLKAADLDVKNIEMVNAYNKEQGASKIEQIDKMMALAQSQAMAMQPLTEQEKAQAQAFAGNLYDNEWNFQNNVFEMLYKVNPKLANAAVMQGTAIQKERLSNDLAMKWLDADIKRAQLNKLLNPNKEYDYKQDKNWNRIAIDKNDPTKQIPIGWNKEQWNPIVSDPTVQTSIAQYSQQQRGRATLQCGELVNDYIKKETWFRWSLGNSFADKVAWIEDIGRSPSPVVWWVFAFDIKTSQGNTWHTGIVTWVNPDWSITVLEANRKENSANWWVPSQGTYTPAQVSNMVFSQAPKNKNLSSVAKEAIKSWQINWTPTVQSGIIEELAKAGEFDKWKGNSTFYTAKPAVKDEIASFAEWYAKRQQAKQIFNKLKADWTLWGATWWFDTLANKGKRFAGAWSTDVNNLNQILAESLSKYMNKISGATVSETEVERLREQIPNLSMWDKQFTDAFEQYDLSMQRWLDNTLTKYWFNSYDDVKQKIYWDNKSEQPASTPWQISSDRQ
jgi:surface antigen